MDEVQSFMMLQHETENLWYRGWDIEISFLLSFNSPFLLFSLLSENKEHQSSVNVVLVNWSSDLSNEMQKSSVGQYPKVVYPAFQSAV